MYHHRVLPRSVESIASLTLRCAAAAVPLSLLWDYSWESTVGIDLAWSPPHVGTYVAVALAAISALVLALHERGVGPRVVLWGALAFVAALLFDRWWQSAYGLAAGIWHPPQLLKAVAFFALVLGAWWNTPGSALASGSVLVLIGVVTLPATFANRQHGAPFYEIACAAYPVVLVACALVGTRRFSATAAALGYTLLVSSLVWLLPLFPAEPLTGPIFNPRDHLLPPPFPLLLVAPAFAIDLLRARSARGGDWIAAIEAGLAFWLVFVVVQWTFSGFMLSPAADNWFFAGGGQHWPFFLQIQSSVKTTFWPEPDAAFTTQRALLAAGLAMISARIGLCVRR